MERREKKPDLKTLIFLYKKTSLIFRNKKQLAIRQPPRILSSSYWERERVRSGKRESERDEKEKH